MLYSMEEFSFLTLNFLLSDDNYALTFRNPKIKIFPDPDGWKKNTSHDDLGHWQTFVAFLIVN